MQMIYNNISLVKSLVVSRIAIAYKSIDLLSAFIRAYHRSEGVSFYGLATCYLLLATATCYLSEAALVLPP